MVTAATALDAVEAASILRGGDSCSGDLPGTGFAAELGNELVYLREAGGGDGVSAGHQAAGGVDRESAAERAGSRERPGAAVANGAEAEILDLLDLSEGCGVVHLSDIDVGWGDACLFIGGKCCSAADVFLWLLGGRCRRQGRWPEPVQPGRTRHGCWRHRRA